MDSNVDVLGDYFNLAKIELLVRSLKNSEKPFALIESFGCDADLGVEYYRAILDSDVSDNILCVKYKNQEYFRLRDLENTFKSIFFLDYHDSYIEDGCYFVAYKGSVISTLGQYLECQSFTEADAIVFTIALAYSLYKLHSSGRSHGGLSLESIFVQKCEYTDNNGKIQSITIPLLICHDTVRNDNSKVHNDVISYMTIIKSISIKIKDQQIRKLFKKHIALLGTGASFKILVRRLLQGRHCMCERFYTFRKVVDYIRLNDSSCFSTEILKSEEDTHLRDPLSGSTSLCDNTKEHSAYFDITIFAKKCYGSEDRVKIELDNSCFEGIRRFTKSDDECFEAIQNNVTLESSNSDREDYSLEQLTSDYS